MNDSIGEMRRLLEEIVGHLKACQTARDVDPPYCLT